MNSEFHAMKAEETVQALESSAQGLSEEEVESRLQKFGPNELRERQRTTALSIFLGQFKSIFVIMLIVAAVASGLIDVHACMHLGTAFVFSLAYFVLNGSLEKARTMAFMQVAVRETLVVWNCRSEKHNAFKVGFLSNKLLLLSVVASLLLTASLLYVPFLQVMFHVVPLGVSDWVIISLVACSGFLIVPEIFAGRKVLRWK